MDQLNDTTTLIIKVNNGIFKQLEPIINVLPQTPTDLTALAISTGETMKRLACCVKLIRLYRDSIPMFSINASQSPFIHPKNPSFEKELTISLNYPEYSITNLFSCIMVALGPNVYHRFQMSPQSPNPFVQCMRITFRLTYFLRVRNLAVKAIRTHDPLEMINPMIALISFPEFSPSAQRAALYVALQCPNRINFRRFAYGIPTRYLTDTARVYYDDFKALLDEDRKLELEHLEGEVEHILTTKETPIFFSTASTKLEDSLVIDFTYKLENIPKASRVNFLIRFFLFEILPDEILTQFREDFRHACERASNLKLGKRNNFTRVIFVQFDQEPVGKFAAPPEKKSVGNPHEIASLFKPHHDYISETRRLHLTPINQ